MDTTLSASSSSMVRNLKRIEPVWRNNLTVVYPLQVNMVNDYQDYLLEKTHSRNIYTLLYDELSGVGVLNELTELKELKKYYKIVSWKDFFITTSVERQPGTGCIHFHSVMGDIVKFSIPCTEDRIQYTQRFNVWLNSLLRSRLLLKSVFTGEISDGVHIKPTSTKVSSYIGESRCKTSVISYNCKNRTVPYVSPMTHRIIKRTNDIDARSGYIPDDLKVHNIRFSEIRKQQDFECRVQYVLK